ncbi:MULTISPECIES: hypothetical protein [Pasteurellaceae]|uniref:D12 class N6 adenine-specific DNA methyltransferase n=1 Tax=Pasteurella atlantica TaxID=2827233 RepID=A0AAW8CT84_9PAST|nr:hypothetical protein [Pasteurella atlantica]MBR0574662.1 hypothetical protein [Pasteurella atlantica]MDP8040577.1 hypothetical protein [Pasteurella atlantica]MDP8042708.1 hypothetical protein [Pasteurella atlantica]MDP8044791.1 hypothetical protein [Pasteurella atlantica]MDP8046889.1 hypothetical protein [Pasteurella atlantica]
MKSKHYFKQAPLPFTGQKRMFLKHFEKILNDNIKGDGKDWTIIDVFGGSGLLSHTAKYLKPQAKVIYNDFDGYSDRLKHINETNQLRKQIYDIVKDTPKNKRLNSSLKLQAIQIINNFKGYKDLNCIASWLLFSGQQVSNFDELYSKTFWNCVRQSDYPNANGYLDGIEVIRESFHTLIPKFKNQEKVLLLLDPPYLCTNQKSYRQDTYFDLIDFLRLINLTKPPYIFFSSTKSEFIRFIDYIIESKFDNYESFKHSKRIKVQTTASYTIQYEDNLVYKF